MICAMADSILFHVEERIAFVTFNRPQRLNALDLAMARALREVVGVISTREDVRAVVLRGTPGRPQNRDCHSQSHHHRFCTACKNQPAQERIPS